ncbi:hypothetical protein ES703_108937 [subsurface metagenome]
MSSSHKSGCFLMTGEDEPDSSVLSNRFYEREIGVAGDAVNMLHAERNELLDDLLRNGGGDTFVAFENRFGNESRLWSAAVWTSIGIGQLSKFDTFLFLVVDPVANGTSESCHLEFLSFSLIRNCLHA